MKIEQIALLALLVGALTMVGCGSDSSSTGTGGTGGSAGTAGMGGGGTGGSGPVDPCMGIPACIVCGQDAIPPDLALFLPDGIRTPVAFTATPGGAVVQGGTVSIAVAAEIVVSLPIMAQGSINEGSTSTYVATAGGDGTLDIVIPEQMLAGQDLVIDGGSGSADFTVDNDATELVIGLDSIVVNLSVTSPAMLDLTLDASETGDCTVEGDGVTIPVEPAQ